MMLIMTMKTTMMMILSFLILDIQINEISEKGKRKGNVELEMLFRSLSLLLDLPALLCRRPPRNPCQWADQRCDQQY